MNARKIKNLARRALGEKFYFKISRLLFPRETATCYGRQQILIGNGAVNEMLKNLMTEKARCSVAKLGATELRLCQEHLELQNGNRKKFGASIVHEIHINSGVFPQTEATLTNFAKLYISYCSRLSHLAVWYRPGEKEFVVNHMPSASLFHLLGLDPIPFGSNSWLQSLANKRVLVISPFIRSIQSQYQRKNQVWRQCPGFLPDFNLLCLKAPLSAGLAKPESPDWETSLRVLIEKMKTLDFDIALIGAGAFSIPLAVEAERQGASSVHLGGQLQVIFGVMGGRWEENEMLRHVVNEFWVRPSGDEVPENYKQNEGGCYW